MIRSHHHGWYLHNARGDVVQRVNAQGVVLHTYTYDAFGVEKDQDANNTNPWRFAGEYWDWTTETIYLRFRSYDPRLGRFTQEDPFWNVGNMQDSVHAILQAGNLYMYCMHNPVAWIDPSGMVSVLLSYIAEREGFTYEVVRHGFLGALRSVDITYNGQTFRHRHTTVGDHLVISSQWLVDNLGFSAERATHQPGDIFSSTDNAALAWGLTYYPHSNRAGRQRELSSNILLADCGGFYFDAPLEGLYDRVAVRPLSEGQTRMAIVHSHPRLLCLVRDFSYARFSPGDMRIMREHGVPLYLVAPHRQGSFNISLRVTYDEVNNRGRTINRNRTIAQNLIFNW